jgi:hypothetical protein
MVLSQRRLWLFWTVSVVGLSAALAQQSTSFRLSEQTLNQGGRPQHGSIATSPRYRVTLDSLGDGIIGRSLSAPSFRMDIGFASAYPPPGEVGGVRFISRTTLGWNHESSIGTYNIYRQRIDQLPGNHGDCVASGLTTAIWSDLATPTAARGFFYLIAAENRLREEGGLGKSSLGVSRSNNTPCP